MGYCGKTAAKKTCLGKTFARTASSMRWTRAALALPSSSSSFTAFSALAVSSAEGLSSAALASPAARKTPASARENMRGIMRVLLVKTNGSTAESQRTQRQHREKTEENREGRGEQPVPNEGTENERGHRERQNRLSGGDCPGRAP